MERVPTDPLVAAAAQVLREDHNDDLAALLTRVLAITETASPADAMETSIHILAQVAMRIDDQNLQKRIYTIHSQLEEIESEIEQD